VASKAWHALALPGELRPEQRPVRWLVGEPRGQFLPPTRQAEVGPKRHPVGRACAEWGQGPFLHLGHFPGPTPAPANCFSSTGPGKVHSPVHFSSWIHSSPGPTLTHPT
jgi:hypothetical protein